MVHFETLSINDSIWLTMTSATTVGYGDFAAKTTWGRISTIILLYVGGIAILAQAAASYFEHRQEVKDRMLRGDWSWVMREHIVFLNCPKEIDEEYFYQAVKGLRRSASELASLPIIIVSEAFNYGISNRLRELDVVYVNKPYFNDEVLKSCSICQAHTIVILSKDQLDPTSDSINFELVHRLREIEVKGRIIVESVRDKNRARLKKAGANNVLRPIRAYPEMLIRAIIAPGSEQIIETLFNSYGEECIRYEVVITRSWLDIIHKFAANDLGIPIAFENGEGDVISVPSSSEVVTAIAIYAIVNEGRSRTNKEIEVILKAA
ncbi:MAG: potassium channel protein [Hyphomicrobiaceae bacterium]|nr:potassium channel protein [Hyphomicrobiaceae bacterium]